MSQPTKTALAVVAVIVLAGAFWLALLGPKREKASELAEQTTSLQSEVATERQRAEAALAAKREFPRYYSELVLLGKAVPAEAATPSLLVQLNGVSDAAGTSFQSITGGSGGSEETTSVVSPGEDASALPPIGSASGPAGLLAMPYSLQFNGGFYEIADFIEGLDSLVKTKEGVVDADGRLVMIDGFDMAPLEEENSTPGELSGTFGVNTYVAPPGQGLTAGATPAGPSTISPEEP
jgi:Tfp pilus assembly protein PilO